MTRKAGTASSGHRHGRAVRWLAGRTKARQANQRWPERAPIHTGGPGPAKEAWPRLPARASVRHSQVRPKDAGTLLVSAPPTVAKAARWQAAAVGIRRPRPQLGPVSLLAAPWRPHLRRDRGAAATARLESCHIARGPSPPTARRLTPRHTMRPPTAAPMALTAKSRATAAASPAACQGA
jgi:hypothetical protein